MKPTLRHCRTVPHRLCPAQKPGAGERGWRGCGWRPRRCWGSHLDRDGDGVACE
ncbi:excalibur calcium-binding domain-containing protein [Streptomyces sp. NPDC059957]|uniref:excalibur calcium-binding domain-containing protein n=1 Tax=unclassified Streptomyces TaxID=2593676 RepID=UPI003660D5E4